MVSMVVTMNQRLAREISLLYKVEAQYKIPAAPVVRQLVEDAERPLPDVLPPQPVWTTFDWPLSGDVNLSHYWKNYDWMNR